MSRLKAPRTTGTIRFDGPMFSADPGRTFRQNVRDLMDAVAAEGAEDAQTRIAGIPPAGIHTGATRAKIVGRVKSRSGRRWASTAVIGIPNMGTPAESIQSHAAIAGIERLHHVMRDTAKSIRAARDVNVAELLKGIA